MWDTADSGHEHLTHDPLSHDLPCAYCGHASHRYLPCDHECGCRSADGEPAALRTAADQR